MRTAAMNPEVLVIGGGLAGCAAAIPLAHAGRSVVVLEREREPRHKVCGEFLSGEALEYLETLGVRPRALGAVAIERVRVCGGQVPGLGVVERGLPFPALSLTRLRLDAALLECASAAGVDVRRGVAVQALAPGAAGDSEHAAAPVRDSAGTEYRAAAVLVASGKHDVPGWKRPPGSQPGLLAQKMYFRLPPEQQARLEGCVELHFFPDGYAGLQMVEDGVANLCALVDSRRFQELGGRWDGLLRHMTQGSLELRERMDGAEALLGKPLAVAAIPYGYVRRGMDVRAGGNTWWLGDQAAVIPSFAGEGMSIALHSGLLAAKTLLAGGDAAGFQRQLAADVSRQVRLATAVSRAAVRPASRGMLEILLGLWPGVVQLLGRQTRIQRDRIVNWE